VDEYRKKGYPDERIRIIASMRPEPLRSEALKILDAEAAREASPEPGRPKGPATEAPDAAAEHAEAPPAKTSPARPARNAAKKASSAPRTKRTAAKKKPAKGKVDRALSKESDTLREERDQLKKELDAKEKALRKLRADVKKLDAEVGDVSKLRKAAEEAAALKARVRELEDAQKERASGSQGALEERIAELEAAIAQKEALIAEKTQIIAGMQGDLVTERSEGAQSANHLQELQQLADRQAQRLAELGDLDEQLAEANEALGQLRREAGELEGREQDNVQRIGLLEESLDGAQAEAGRLRSQIKINEEAVDMLQRKVAAREAEFDSLRDHFEKEASDLKKRAEREMWAIRRKLSTFKAVAGVGGAAAALLVVFLGATLLFGGGGDRATETRLAEMNRKLAERDDRIADLASRNARFEDQVAALTQQLRARRVARNDDGGAAPRPITGSIRRERDEASTRTSAPRGADEAILAVHTVQKNDKLWDISKKYYGTGVHWQKIQQANEGIPENSLKIGVKLLIPKLEND
jgi:LysM repeat protein